MSDIPDNLRQAIGRIVTAEDDVTAAPVAGLMAAFGYDDPAPKWGDPLPPLWHGLFCTAKLPPSRLGPDGLARDEGLLPAASEFPNKLFGGARFAFDHPIRIGDHVRKESEVRSFERKQGRTGDFIVGLVEHRIFGGDTLCVVEQNDIIFRPPAAASGGGGSAPAGETAKLAYDWSRTVTPDPVLMFRHSAVTFNSHRIHYDRDYVRQKGYPGLLVQGTLIARLMIEFLMDVRPDFVLGRFSFRSGRPIYDDGDFDVVAVKGDDRDKVDLRAIDRHGNIGMSARAEQAAE